MSSSTLSGSPKRLGDEEAAPHLSIDDKSDNTAANEYDEPTTVDEKVQPAVRDPAFLVSWDGPDDRENPKVSMTILYPCQILIS